MILEVSKNSMFLPTACDIWDNLQKTCSMKKDTAICYELKMKIFAIKVISL